MRHLRLLVLVSLLLVSMLGCEKPEPTVEPEPVAAAAEPHSPPDEEMADEAAAEPSGQPERSAERARAIAEAAGLMRPAWSRAKRAAAEAGEESAGEQQEDRCDELRGDIRRRQQRLPRACETDEECMILYLGCPFGCGQFVSKSRAATKLKEDTRAFRKECRTCMYRCRDPGIAVCSKGICRKEARQKTEIRR